MSSKPQPSSKKESVRELMEFNMKIAEIGECRVSKSDENAYDRAKLQIEEYFLACQDYGIPPTWEGLAVAMGTNRFTLSDWRDGKVHWIINSGIRDLLDKAHAVISSFQMTGMQIGTIKEIPGIFGARNTLGYTNADEDKKQIEVKVSLTADQLIEEARNLQLTDKKKRKPKATE